MTVISLEPGVVTAIPLALLNPSPTNPRKHFDQRALAQLAASIRDRGVLQPILVRPRNDEFEIVAGERRMRAARAAGLFEIPALIRDLGDDEAREIQLVENGQRVDLTPLEEADTYAELERCGYNLHRISKAVSKGAVYVERRMRLSRLHAKVRKVLEEGRLPVSHAELIARIGNAEDHAPALEAISTGFGESRTYVTLKRAKEIIEEQFMCELAAAPFDLADASLSPLGACTTCPQRSGNSRSLFGDVKNRDVCTNPKDFRAKVDAWLQKERARGLRVLVTEEEVKTVFPYGPHGYLANGYVDADSSCPEDPKGRTYAKLLGKSLPRHVILAFVGGKLRRVLEKKMLRSQIEARGHTFLATVPETEPRTKTDRADLRAEKAARKATVKAFAAKLPGIDPDPTDWLEVMALVALCENQWTAADLLAPYGYAHDRGDTDFTTAAEFLQTLPEGNRRSFILHATIRDWSSPNMGATRATIYAEAMRLYGVEVEEIAATEVRRIG